MVESVKNEKKNIDKSLYLALEVCDKLSFFKNAILPAINEATQKTKSTELNDLKTYIEKLVETDLKEPNHVYSPQKSIHVTTYFKGKGKYDKNNPAYQEFEEEKTVDIVIPGVIFVPNRIVTAIAFPNAYVNNEFPHITSMLGSYKAFHSNAVCEVLFQEGGVLKEDYSKKFKDLKEGILISSKTTIIDKNIEEVFVYIFPSEKQVKVESKMKAN